MRVSRYEAMERELTPVARKVFECVPVQEAWTAFRISAELKRQGTPKDRRLIDWCLSSLIRDGLIKHDTPADTYQRVEPRVVALNLVPKEPEVNAKKPSPMERMAALAERTRRLSLDLKVLADDIDAAAVLIDEEINEAGNDTKKLRQLQTLLKELT